MAEPSLVLSTHTHYQCVKENWLRIHTFHKHANVTQDFIMKYLNKGEIKRKQRGIIILLPDSIKGGILVLAHWSVSDDLSLQHPSPITPLFRYHISYQLNRVWAKIFPQRGNRRLISFFLLFSLFPSSWRKQRGLMTAEGNYTTEKTKRGEGVKKLSYCVSGDGGNCCHQSKQSDRTPHEGLMPPACQAFIIWDLAMSVFMYFSPWKSEMLFHWSWGSNK